MEDNAKKIIEVIADELSMDEGDITLVNVREENGEFTDISQIMNVNGIGEKTFAKIKDFIKTEETQK